jgi:hypothetical protein
MATILEGKNRVKQWQCSIAGLGLENRQAERKATTLSDFAFNADRAAVQFDQMPHDG